MVKFFLDEVDFGSAANYTDEGEFLEEADLRYALFYARVGMRADGIDVIGPRSLVSFFDFLACIAWALPSVRAGEAESLDFTESADEVFFHPVADGSFDISHSGKDLRIRVARADLVEAFVGFLDSGRQLLIDNVPGIQRNPAMSKLEPFSS